MQHWREGYGGALRMGIVHGAYCLGCCWALFAVLVAAGVMSLAWMAVLTLVIFAEKILPFGRRAPRTSWEWCFSFSEVWWPLGSLTCPGPPKRFAERRSLAAWGLHVLVSVSPPIGVVI